jgi:hypothetical protein
MHGDVELAAIVLSLGLLVSSVTLSVAIVIAGRRVAGALTARLSRRESAVEREA